jgi:hypothetical protein
MGSGACEQNANFVLLGLLSIDMDYTALLFLPAIPILKDKRLSRLYVHHQSDKCAMGINHERVTFFR